MPDSETGINPEEPRVTTPADFKKEVDEFSDEQSKWHADRLAEAKDTGRSLGKTNLPETQESTPTPFEGQLRGMYEARLGLMQQRFNEKLQAWYAMYAKAHREADRTDVEWKRIKDEQRQYVDEKEADRLENIKRTYAEKYEPLRDQRDAVVQSQMNEAEEKINVMRLKHGRQFPNAMMTNPWVYFFILGVIGACEFPLNAFVFGVVGASQAITYLMASSLVLAIPVAAHFAGTFLKRRAERPINILLFSVITLLIVGLSYLMGQLRCAYMVSTTGNPCNEQLEILFVVLNVILFGLGVLLAYAHHDESREFEQAWIAWERAKFIFDERMPAVQALIEAAQEQMQRNRSKLGEEVAADLKAINDMEIMAQQNRTNAIATYDSALETLTGLERIIRSNFQEAISAFQNSNLAARTNHAQPKSFSPDYFRPLPKHYENMAEVNPNPENEPNPMDSRADVEN